MLCIKQSFLRKREKNRQMVGERVSKRLKGRYLSIYIYINNEAKARSGGRNEREREGGVCLLLGMVLVVLSLWT
jgi:hypothetical protein